MAVATVRENYGKYLGRVKDPVHFEPHELFFTLAKCLRCRLPLPLDACMQALP
jgi:hypothetical protein